MFAGWWNPCTPLRRKHPPLISCFYDEQSTCYRNELTTVVSMLGSPIFGPMPLEGKCKNRNIALGQATQFGGVFGY